MSEKYRSPSIYQTSLREQFERDPTLMPVPIEFKGKRGILRNNFMHETNFFIWPFESVERVQC